MEEYEVVELKQQAPKPRRIVCLKEISNKPAYYGKEFHGLITKKEAEDLVSEHDGCYLLRESVSRTPGCYALAMRFGDVFKHYRLLYDGMHYIGEERFETIRDLVANGLNALYTKSNTDMYDLYPKAMMISPVKDEGKTVNDEIKENNEIASEYMETKAPYELHPHDLKIHTFKGRKTCDICWNSFWGSTKQGVKCQDCGFRSHTKCVKRIPAGDCHPAEKYLRSKAEKRSQKSGEKAAIGEMKGNEYAKQTEPFTYDTPKAQTPSGTFDEQQSRHENGVEGQQEDIDEQDDGKAPLEIIVRGPLAVRAYQKALLEGKTNVKRVPIMLIGQGQAGKTSLKRSLKGELFDPEETSTTGIETDPSYLKVSTESWKVGEKTQATDSDSVPISYEHRTAQFILSSLKEEEITSRPSQFKYGETMDGTGGPSVLDHKEHVSEISDASRPWAHEISHDTLLTVPEVPGDIATMLEKLLLLDDNGKDEEEIYSILWDFGGQSVYYVTHPLFLTTRAIYFLVYNLSWDPYGTANPQVKPGLYKNIEDVFCERSNIDYLQVWMSSVSSLVSQDEDPQEKSEKSEILPEKLPPVFLVCTHADKPFNRKCPDELARELYSSLQAKIHGEHLVDFFVVDNTKSGSEQECPGVARLRNAVLSVAKELPQMKEDFPIKWLKYEKALQVRLEDGYKWISLDEAKKIAIEECEISSDEQFQALLNFLHDQRILIHFDDTPELNRMVILDPQWLIDVFKKVIAIKPNERKGKKFKELWLKLETTGILEEKLLQHVWGPLFDNEETSYSLVAMMDKFCLLCPWPSSADSMSICREYLVPSMLMFPPKEDVTKLIASAGIPSLFLKFKSGQVPPGLFPRLVLMVFQWCNKEWPSQVHPQLHHNFAWFYSHPAQGCSIILLCHSSYIEVVVHKEDEDEDVPTIVPPEMKLSSETSYDTFQVTIARTVCRQLGLMLECMRKEFHWLKNMAYEMSVRCPVCCKQGSINHCRSHNVRGCKQEECLHFWSESQLRNSHGLIICNKSLVAGGYRIPVKFFGHWFKFVDEQRVTDGREGRALPFKEGDGEQALVLPSVVLECLQLQTCDPSDVVARLQKSLPSEQASLEQPDQETKQRIRCLCMKAKTTNRLDVVKKLREITPAGTTGPLLPEALDVRTIPFHQRRDVTIDLSGGDEWKPFAERLGLTPKEIRYLEKRVLNPCDAALAHSRNQGYISSVGDLYDALVDCELPLIADLL